MGAAGIAHFCQRLVNMIFNILRACASLKLVNFFGLSFVFYGIGAMVTMMWSEEAHKHLCTIPAYVNRTAVPPTGVSCANCSDNLAMCLKVEQGLPTANCYQRSMNATWKKFASTNRMPYFDDFMEASMARECFKSVGTATDPVAMVRSISRQAHGADPDTQIVPGCKNFHCKVMLEATKDNPDLSNLYDDNGCSNLAGVKPGWDATWCPCNVIKNLPFSTAARLQAYCGDAARNFSDHILWKTFYTFDECYTKALRAAAAAYEEPWRLLLASATESVSATAPPNDEELCVEYMEGSTAAWDFFGDIKAANDLVRPPQQAFAMPERCKIIMCFALNQTLFVDECHWTDSPNLITVDLDSIVFAAQQCASFFTLFADWNLPTPAIMTRQLICNSYEGAPILAMKQRLGFCPPSAPGAGGGGPPGGGPGGGGAAAGRRLSAVTRNLLEHPRNGSERNPPDAATVLDVAPRPEAEMQAGSPPHDEAANASGHGVLAELLELQTRSHDSLARRTQDEEEAAPAADSASSGGGANAALPPWETAPWGDCHCYQQCIAGYKRRTVVCPAPPCMSPRPKWVSSCVCSHCAACNPSFFFFIAMCSFGAQAALSLLTFLSFAKIDGFVEEDLASVGFLDKIIGCLCKLLPSCIKIVLYVSLVTTAYLAFMTVMPMIVDVPGFKECANTQALLRWVIAASGILFLQLTLGIYIKKNRSVAAWLYSPTKPGMLKLICTPIRAIGP